MYVNEIPTDNNPLYKDIQVDISNIDSNLTALQNDADDNDTHQQAI